MINISRFIAVQEAITSQVDELVRTMLREIRNYYRAGEQAMEYDTFRLLRKTWDKYYAPMETIDFEWSDIQEALHAAVASVEVRTINGGNASKYLNYDEYDNGLRLIAVGGLSLSRGLTLEGLCISYFYRNSRCMIRSCKWGAGLDTGGTTRISVKSGCRQHPCPGTPISPRQPTSCFRKSTG